jgi:hypothetical protein
MTPDPLLNPAFDHSKTDARMTDPKVVHPTPQNRIDFRNHNLDGPADMLSEDPLSFSYSAVRFFSLGA